MAFDVRKSFGILSGWLPVAMLAISLSGNLYLSWRLAHPSAPSTALAPLKVGQEVLTLELKDSTGRSATRHLDTGQEANVIYVFTPTCI
jgi:hypothetical protein